MKNPTILAAALAASFLTAASLEASAAARPGGHLIPNNDGKLSWVADANGNPAKFARKAIRERKVRVAALGDAHVPETAHEAPQAARPMGERPTELAPGSIRSKEGATAHVAAKLADRFQRYIDAIDAAGGRVLFMNGIDNRGACHPPRHKHGCGWALDVCQLARGVVDARCHLPSPPRLAEIAASVGLFEGGRWCDTDYGHAEWGPGVKGCASRSIARGRQVDRSRVAVHRHPHYRHHHRRIASRSHAA